MKQTKHKMHNISNNEKVGELVR